MKNHIYLIIKREFLSRVRRKSFIISTILMPVLMIGLMALPTIIASVAGPEDKKVALVDHTGYISRAFLGSENMEFEISDEKVEKLKSREDLDAILEIPADVVDNPDKVVLYTNGSPSPQTEMYISQLLANTIEQVKLSRYNIEGLDQIINDVHTDVNIKTIRIDGDSEQEASSIASYIVGMILSLILYMFIMLYGQMVMTSIIEEKNNRVLEIVVSSVKPTNLMLGKIVGIGAVAVTQILIWGLIIGIFSLSVMPNLLTGVITPDSDMELVQMLNAIGNPMYIMGLFGLMTLFMILGYLFYSSICAAIGSAVDNVQDASQLQSLALVPIILGMVFSMTVLNDPGSDFALVLSLIPFTSPMVMMARLPFGLPAWEIALSLVILAVSMLIMIWLSAKIYRVGIFMYGKKPNIKDLIRWARYK